MAEVAVQARHLRRLWGLPRTALGSAGWPPTLGQRLHNHWNYWWQAHLLECLVDAQLRAPTPVRLATIERLIHGIKLRNFGNWTNDYYDDVAWLGLALLRGTTDLGMPPSPALPAIVEQLREGWTDHAGGGIWWRRNDTFKNAPANGPAAILLARLSRHQRHGADQQRALAMTQWMDDYLLDEPSGLIWDGLYANPDGSVRERIEIVYTYCQGVFLGACVELAADGLPGRWVDRAERTIAAVERHLAPGGVLMGQGGGDGGLFAGILARYLVQAARVLPGYGSPAASTAARIVFTSAQAAWRNRGAAPGGPLFGPDWAEPAVTPRSARDPHVERDLSVQVGGWMVLEAAAALEILL